MPLMKSLDIALQNVDPLALTRDIEETRLRLQSLELCLSRLHAPLTDLTALELMELFSDLRRLGYNI